jgi:hypothetical protein
VVDACAEVDKFALPASNRHQGARRILTQNPIAGPADPAGVRMRAVGAPARIETIRAMGAEPTPIARGEVHAGLQLIDAAEAQPTAIWGVKALADLAAAGVGEHEVDLAPCKAAVTGVCTLPDLEKEAAIVKGVLAA